MLFFFSLLQKQNMFIKVKNQNIQANWKREKKKHIIFHMPETSTTDTLGVPLRKFSNAKQSMGSYCKYCFVVCSHSHNKSFLPASLSYPVRLGKQRPRSLWAARDVETGAQKEERCLLRSYTELVWEGLLPGHPRPSTSEPIFQTFELSNQVHAGLA